MPTKTPQDRKTPQAEQDAEKQRQFADVEGHELLKPFSKVKGSDQARLTNRLIRLDVFDDVDEDTEDADEKDFSIQDLDLDAVADLIDYVSEKFALDSNKFDEFTMGQGGMQRAMDLTIAYASEMGKGED
ncbi:hypothetical protein [Brachybacterium kimchii]|uniref:Acyl carrier protein n=1 Tax=Brachybacterium kimchii TaxID=2942909 RepID=A0ABY4N969_9MICO|nr:hypothetical protein [Brachybacterium kimchii]UQN30654.1 hypothetical protein M4486_04955 [Brachybacterium kimchii]